MKAIKVIPGDAESCALSDIPEPEPGEGPVLVETICLGVCGTDLEILAGTVGQLPKGQTSLIIGHECLGRVIEAPHDSPIRRGDLVVAMARRPDRVPCSACAAEEWDMCLNDGYTERGIRGAHGFGAERWRTEHNALVRVPDLLADVAVLLEPGSIAAKAWERIESIQRPGMNRSKVVLVTGAGAVGLLSALMATQRGHTVHVVDRLTTGPKPELVQAIDAVYHSELPDLKALRPDIIIECTGSPELIMALLQCSVPNNVTCLLGISANLPVSFDLGLLGREIVLNNRVIVGAANSNRTHYEHALEALLKTPLPWLARIITRRVPLATVADAFRSTEGEIKSVVMFPPARHILTHAGISRNGD